MTDNQAKKPRLLLLVTQADFGGAQKYVFDMAGGLREEWEVTVGTGEVASPSYDSGSQRQDTGLLDRAKAAGLPTKIFFHLRREINPWHDLAAVFEVARYLRREQPDVVLANSSKAEVISALAGLLVKCSRSAGVHPPHAEMAGGAQGHALHDKRPKLVATIHGFAFLEPVNPIRKLVYFLMQWIAGRLRDATIVLSEYEKNIAQKYHIVHNSSFIIHNSSLNVIPHGIGEIKFLDRDVARARLNLPKEKTIMGTIANLYATKGLDVLVRARGEIATADHGRPHNDNTLFVIIGDGPERPRLEEQIRDKQLIGPIGLMGPIPNAAEYLKAFDVFVLPSRKEGFPYTLLEAAAAGLPIVATTVGAVPEILRDGIEARLVPPNNPEALARAIQELLDDPAHAQALGLAARERVRTVYSKEQEILKTNEVLKILIHSPAG